MINGIPRILIIRLSAIGDVVRVLPALHALRDYYPNAQIDWAVECKSAEIVRGHPALDECLVFERTPGKWAGLASFRRFCAKIRARRYDMALDFHGILKSGWISRASRARDRYGFARPRGRELSHLFSNHKVKLPSMRMNRVAENLALCRAVGAESGNLEVTIHVPDDVQNEVDAYFDQASDGGKKVVALHPAVDRPGKQWPIENFALLSDLLLADGRYEVLVTWGPGQRELAEEVRTRSRRNPEVAPETPDLKHYARMVQRADLFFGGDTGPMHIAWALGTPVVAVFGGTDPAKHAPFRKPCEILYAGPKNPPKLVSLPQAQAYLRQITPEMAYDACVRLTER